MERLTPRVRWVWMVGALVRASILVTVLLLAASYAIFVFEVGGGRPEALLAVAALGFVWIVFVVVHAWFRYRVWRFEVQSDALFIRRGVFTRIKTVAPYVRIQHVDTRRNPIERATGLATVVVYTAGSRSADVSIPGLTPERAENLREELRRLTIESEGEDAV